MGKIAITDTGSLDPAEAVEFLTGLGHEVAVLDTTDPRALVERAADADALIVSFIDLDADTLARLPRLRVIATMAVGYNRIDVAAARSNGIDVCNMPSAACEEVAVHALAGILGMTRFLPESTEQVRRGGWDYASLPLPPRLSQQRLGLFGLGRIARYLADLAQPLFGEVVAFDPYVRSEDWPAAVRRVDTLEALLPASDVLSLHALLTEETRGVIDARALNLMPRGSFLVNVSRGELVVRDDLLTALDSGHLRRAFLDVLETEPPTQDDCLVAHPSVDVTPHLAFRSEQTLRDYVLIPARNVAAVLEGRAPLTLVN